MYKKRLRKQNAIQSLRQIAVSGDGCSGYAEWVQALTTLVILRGRERRCGSQRIPDGFSAHDDLPSH